jgi:hypothetical protein
MDKKITLLVLILTALLPWHSLLINGYLNPLFPIINIWKEIIIVLLFVNSLIFFKNFQVNINPFSFFLFLLFLIGVCGYFYFGPYGMKALYGFKSYFLPIMFVFTLTVLKSRINWDKVAKLFVINSIIMSIFSISQQFILGEDIYLNAGYPPSLNDSSKLNFAFYIGFGLIQRGAGGFIAPIPYSVYLVLALLILFAFRKKIGFKFYKLSFAIISLSLILTFTRSTIAAYVLFFLLPISIKKTSFFFRFLGIACVMTLVIYIYKDIPYFQRTLESFNTFWENATKLNDSSTIGHFNSFEKGIDLCLNNLYIGNGIGTIGPHTAVYIDKPIVLESAYLSVCAELGIFMCLMFFFLFFFFDKIYNSIAFSLLLVFAAVGFFLPLNYYLELTLLFIIAYRILNVNHLNDYYSR